jgi:ubiquinone/menaquinone biosynthesis C-methylase UbiE
MTRWPLALLTVLLAFLTLAFGLAQPSVADSGIYRYQSPSRDGIGKLYFGREIAQVMGHRGAAWLERSSRTVEEHPDQVVAAMALTQDASVADIGAGTGYFTFRLASLVPEGRVFAVDIQPEMLTILEKRIARRGITNVVPVLGAIDDPRLPEASVDAVLLVDAYHEFAYPFEMMQAIVRSLRPQGRVFLIEYRGEDPRIPIKPLHKMTQDQAIREVEAVGLRWVETRDFLPTQHFMVFEKSAGH